MTFELLTYPGREIIQLAAHAYMTCFQNEYIYIHKMHILYRASFFIYNNLNFFQFLLCFSHTKLIKNVLFNKTKNTSVYHVFYMCVSLFIALELAALKLYVLYMASAIKSNMDDISMETKRGKNIFTLIKCASQGLHLCW